MIYKFRITLDVLDDVIRDIAIRQESTLEDLHDAINQAFGLECQEMASFYLADEKWNQGKEYTLENFGESITDIQLMGQTQLEEVLSVQQTRLIYVYDFLNMWTFYVELAAISESLGSTNYPDLLFAQGQLPENPPEKNYTSDFLDQFNDEFSEELNNDGQEMDDFDFDNF